MPMPEPSTFNQIGFRFRRTDNQGLNAAFDGGDPAENVDITSGAGSSPGDLLRLRIRISESAGGNNDNGFRLQVSRNSGSYVDCSAYTATSGIGPVVVALSSQFADGAATTELLTGSNFVGGEGVEENSGNGDSSGPLITSQETELEWCIFIHSFFDGYLQNVAGNTLDFRVVEANGTAFTGSYTEVPRITITETDYWVGGVIPETPSNIGPFADTNGNLYYVMELSHTSGNIDLRVVKSTNGGKTWRVQTGGIGPPTTGDVEGVDVFQDGDVLHIFHQQDGDSFWYHQYATSDHSTDPDEWLVRDQVPDTGSATAPIQMCGLSVLSTGALWGFWKEGDTDEDIYYRQRTSGGTWTGTKTLVDNTASVSFTGVSVVLGANNLTHIFYHDDTNGDVYHKSLSSGGTLSGRQLVMADSGTGVGAPITQAVYWDDGGNEKVMIVILDDSDQLLYSVVVTDDGTPETRRAASGNTCSFSLVGSDQPVANLAIDASTKTAYLHYADATTGDIFRDVMVNDGGWGTDVEEQDGVTCNAIRGRVFTHSSTNGGSTVVGYVWVPTIGDNDPTNNGFQQYDEYIISTPANDNQTAYTKGGVNVTDNKSAYVNGSAGGTPTSDSQAAYIKGQDTASDNQPAYMVGGINVADNQAAYMVGGINVADSQAAFIAGGVNVLDNQSAYTQGQDTATDSQPAFIAGGVNVLDNQSAYMQGQDTAADSQPAFITGGVNVTDNQAAYTAGVAGAVDNQPAFIAGAVNVADNQAAYMQGVDTASDSQAAYTDGIASAADNKSAYMAGTDTAADNQPAYVAGGINVSDSKSAYINAAAVFTSDNKSAYMAGVDTTSDNQSAFLAGGINVSDSQAAYTVGGINISDNQAAYLKGQDTASDNQAAYTVGSIDVSDSQAAYVAGGIDVSDNQAAYIVGGINVSDNQAAYMEGVASASDSKSAFTQGLYLPLPVTEPWTGTDNDPWRLSHWVTEVVE